MLGTGEKGKNFGLENIKKSSRIKTHEICILFLLCSLFYASHHVSEIFILYKDFSNFSVMGLKGKQYNKFQCACCS
jgi:hypothetical protein